MQCRNGEILWPHVQRDYLTNFQLGLSAYNDLHTAFLTIDLLSNNEVMDGRVPT